VSRMAPFAIRFPSFPKNRTANRQDRSICSPSNASFSSRAPGRSLPPRFAQALLLGLAYNLTFGHRFLREDSQSPSLFPKDLRITKSFGICTYKKVGGWGCAYLSFWLSPISQRV